VDEFSDGKLIFKTPPQDVVWSEIDDPNKWEVQEPYGYFRYDMRLNAWIQNREDTKGIAFYTTPLKKEWVGLTDDEIAQLMFKCDVIVTGPTQFDFARAIEAKLKEKNR
jgi:hypothetical protein